MHLNYSCLPHENAQISSAWQSCRALLIALLFFPIISAETQSAESLLFCNIVGGGGSKHFLLP